MYFITTPSDGPIADTMKRVHYNRNTTLEGAIKETLRLFKKYDVPGQLTLSSDGLEHFVYLYRQDGDNGVMVEIMDNDDYDPTDTRFVPMWYIR